MKHKVVREMLTEALIKLGTHPNNFDKEKFDLMVIEVANKINSQIEAVRPPRKERSPFKFY